MKVSVEERGKKFEPITLTLVIETREELLDLLARLDLENGEILSCVKTEKAYEKDGVQKEIECACVRSEENPEIVRILCRLAGVSCAY